MFMDMPLKGFSQNRKKGYWPEVTRVREILVLGNRITMAAFRAAEKLFCSMHKL